MLDERAAIEAVLRMVNGDRHISGRGGDKFVVEQASLSSRGDYWIVSANSEAFVSGGDFSKLYVGVGAYLVDVTTGEIEIVGSGQSVETYLEDKYDEREASGGTYILTSSISRDDKPAIARLHQILGCPLIAARELAVGSRLKWFTGRRRVLKKAQRLLAERGVRCEIAIGEVSSALPRLSDHLFGWDDLQRALHARAST